MNETKKIQAFEYIVIQLAKISLGYNLKYELNKSDIDKFNENNDFSKLKLLKLLFLICVSEPNKPLLQIFDRFYAMQYGPVELTLFTNINNAMNHINIFTCIKVNNQKTEIQFEKITNIQSIEDFGILNKEQIDNVIFHFINNSHTIKLLTKNHWYLVELTHKYQSWKEAFVRAKAIGKGLFPMPTSSIYEDDFIIAL